jgi:hypothetical protein
MTGANLRSTRQRLPNRRGSQAFVLEAGGLSFSAVASGFDDESLGKVFSQKRTAGSTVGFMVSEAASASSLTLQFGCPVEKLCTSVCRDAHGAATGPLNTTLDMLAGEVA